MRRPPPRGLVQAWCDRIKAWADASSWTAPDDAEEGPGTFAGRDGRAGYVVQVAPQDQETEL